MARAGETPVLGEFVSAEELRVRAAELEPCPALDLIEAARRRVSAEAEAIAGLRRQALLRCQESSGLNATQLAERLGLPVEAPEDRERSGALVRQWLKDARDQLGRTATSTGGRPDEYADKLTEDRLAELLIRRRTLAEIADAYDASTTTVTRYLKRYGLSSRRITGALKESTDPATLDELTRAATPLDPFVRAAVAANPMAARHTLEALAKDDAPMVRCQVAANPSTPPDTLRALAGDTEQDQATRSIATAATTTEPDDLERILSESEGEGGVLARRAAASNPHLPLAQLAILADDPDKVVAQIATARSPSTPLADLINLLGAGLTVRLVVAANPKLPAAHLSPDDRHPLMRRIQEAAHRETLAERLNQLAGDESPLVRRRVAANPRTPAERLTALAVDPDPSVRSAAAANPSISASGRAAGGLLAD